jgi:hypothetical protein
MFGAARGALSKSEWSLSHWLWAYSYVEVVFVTACWIPYVWDWVVTPTETSAVIIRENISISNLSKNAFPDRISSQRASLAGSADMHMSGPSGTPLTMAMAEGTSAVAKILLFLGMPSTITRHAVTFFIIAGVLPWFAMRYFTEKWESSPGLRVVKCFVPNRLPQRQRAAIPTGSPDWWMVWLTAILAFVAFLQLIVFSFHRLSAGLLPDQRLGIERRARALEGLFGKLRKGCQHEGRLRLRRRLVLFAPAPLPLSAG